MTKEVTYTADMLMRLSALEHVRRRPAMYIGCVDSRGLHQLVEELLDYSLDEAHVGHVTRIEVTLHQDGSVTVEDNGRGLPIAIHVDLSREAGREVSIAEGVMTSLAYRHLLRPSYGISGGLHGIGLPVVNFLSRWCEVEVCRDGQVWRQRYERGVPTSPVRAIGASRTTGTKITLQPDAQIFTTTRFDTGLLRGRLRELAFLNRGVSIELHDHGQGVSETFQFKRGLIEYVEHLNLGRLPVHDDAIYGVGDREGTSYEFAIQYVRDLGRRGVSYVNSFGTIEGGTHVSGFHEALQRTLSEYGQTNGWLASDYKPDEESWRAGLSAVLVLRTPHPQFVGSRRNKLAGEEIQQIVGDGVGAVLARFWKRNPRTAEAILRHGLWAAERSGQVRSPDGDERRPMT